MNASLLRQGKFLEYITLGWNITGVFILLLAVQATHAISLIAFGFDTLLEIGASIIVIWELNGTGGERQRQGLSLLSIAFFILGIYILIQSIINSAYHILPAKSLLGIAWLFSTFIVMMLLALKKNQIGKLLNNPVLLTEARVTVVDACLALIVLMSILFTAWFDWWWADIAGGFILMVYCFYEAIHIWRELSEVKNKSDH
jgi:divalent metal cation (Fe/Co/Zn/Cd) transporter